MTDKNLPTTSFNVTENHLPTLTPIMDTIVDTLCAHLQRRSQAGREAGQDLTVELNRNDARLGFVLVVVEAAANGREDILDYLLRAGCPLNDVIYLAASRGKSLRVFEVLRNHRWQVNDPCMENKLPILGSISDDPKLTDWFFSLGADPNIKNIEGNTPFSEAVRAAPKETILLFYQKGARIDQGWLFHYAVRRNSGETEIVDLLITLFKREGKDAGEWLNKVLYNGVHPSRGFMLGLGTPLHEAISQKKVDVARHLIGRGASPFIQDSTGRTAVVHAQGSPEFAELMKPYETYQRTRNDSVYLSNDKA